MENGIKAKVTYYSDEDCIFIAGSEIINKFSSVCYKIFKDYRKHDYARNFCHEENIISYVYSEDQCSEIEKILITFPICV